MTKELAVLLDYDGFICKAFYASLFRGSIDFNDVMLILSDLEDCAISKAKDFAQGRELKIAKVISGHTYKKDVYPSYKAKRKRNEDLGVFREFIKLEMDDLLCVPNLEADDVIIMMSEEYDSIVFSDDKDLRYYVPQYCKININEAISYQEDFTKRQLVQLLTGDKEDNVQGINNVGDKTAEKLLDMYGWNINSVIEIYRDKQVTIDECLKNLLLISPIRKENVIDYRYGLDDSATLNNILGHFRYWNEKVTEIYER